MCLNNFLYIQIRRKTKWYWLNWPNTTIKRFTRLIIHWYSNSLKLHLHRSIYDLCGSYAVTDSSFAPWRSIPTVHISPSRFVIIINALRSQSSSQLEPYSGMIDISDSLFRAGHRIFTTILAFVELVHR